MPGEKIRKGKEALKAFPVLIFSFMIKNIRKIKKAKKVKGSPEKNISEIKNVKSLNLFSFKAQRAKKEKEIEPISKGKSQRERKSPEKIMERP